MSLVKSFTEITRSVNILDDFGKKIGKTTTKIQDFGDKASKTVTTVRDTATGTLKTVNKSEWKAFGKSMEETGKAAKKGKFGAAVAGGIQSLIGSLIEPIIRPLVKLFKPFGIVFDILGAGLQQELLPIMK
jgi:hypothetical protein